MIKLMIAVKRRPGMRRQALREHLSVKHAASSASMWTTPPCSTRADRRAAS